MSRPRIGLNLLWMVPGIVGGSEEYSTRLLRSVAAAPPADLELVLFANGLFTSVYPDLAEAFETVVAPISGRNKPIRVAAENTWLDVHARRREIAVMHHLGGIVPFVHRTPAMVTIHDLQPLAMPGHFSRTKRLFHRLALPRSVHGSVRVVTLTDYTRRDLVDRLHLSEEQIVLVPSGITMPVYDAQTPSGVPIRERYGLEDLRFFLYPAITYPHKNHLMLLDAFRSVVDRHPDAALVLTGGPSRLEDDVLDSVRRRDLHARVFRLGRIPRADLDALYRAAVGLVFPSRFEGFGIPVLEAMSRGCPVIAADGTALPEVVGDAGVLVAPRDVTGWTAAMVRLLDDDDLRTDLEARGLSRAATFDWAGPAEALEAVYRAALEEVR